MTRTPQWEPGYKPPLLNQFLKGGIRRPFLFIAGVAVVGYSLRWYMVSQASEAFKEQRELRQQKVDRTLRNMGKLHNPELDYERVWKKVLAEEARIEAEESAAGKRQR